MGTERKSLLAMVLGRLTQGQVPVDGMHIWEPTGAIKFTTARAVTTPSVAVKSQITEKQVTGEVPQAGATAGYRACPL